MVFIHHFSFFKACISSLLLISKKTWILWLFSWFQYCIGYGFPLIIGGFGVNGLVVVSYGLTMVLYVLVVGLGNWIAW